ncbi:lysylphosphatidylglycerol synthase transmembrane domain-containing protein [Bradyrhizobium sp.]|uniref:lysylphosphatidylglycerol synthase transmembrane domain-containing protein n=1 Tax=Bradyrhizobium sp. TaxID=376 RepID=UPI003BAEDD6D
MRRLLFLSARIIVSLALLYLALRGINFAAIEARLTQINLSWIVAAALINLIQIFLGALRWREISALCQAPLTDLQAFRYNMIGAFFNQTLPSSIGGDAVRLWLVKHTGAGWRAATYSILTDRAIGLIALALIIVASLPWSYQLIADSNGRLALVFVDFAALGGGLGFLLLGHLPWRWLKTWWPTKHVHACSVIANKVIFNWRSGPKIATLSLSIHVLAVVIAWCAVRSISAPANFEQVFMLIPPIMLITMIPISIAGWGVREATMMVAFGYAGLAQMDGTVVSILFGAVYFIVGALGGLVWILSTEKAEKLPDENLGLD